MELLFNKATASGSEEIKELIGHIDSDIDFDALKPDIITESKSIIKIIGKSVYDAALVEYALASPDFEFVNAVRYPILIGAIKSQQNSSDLSRSNNGRRMRVDENNKLPFAWMLDRDNEVFERKYYRALDDLIDYLDEENTLWKNSDAYAKSQRYYVRTTSDFDEYFPINSRFLLYKIQPGLRICERREIIPIIGMELHEQLKSNLKTDTLLSEEEENLIDLIKEACVWYALSWSMKVLRVNLFPEGILQSYVGDRISSKATKVSEKMEVELAAQEFAKQAQDVLLDIQKLVCLLKPEATQEQKDSITKPNFGFDDCDDFVSL